MSQNQQKYSKISKLFKSIIDAITKLELMHLKNYMNGLNKAFSKKKEGKDTNKENKETTDPIFDSEVLQQFPNLSSLLNDLKQAKGKVAIHYAAARGDVSIVDYMIYELGIDVHIKDKEGNNAYTISIEHGHLELVRYFLDKHNYQANSYKDNGVTGMHIAANHNHTGILELLIQRGGDVNRMSIHGCPINWATGNKHVEATQLLLEHNADSNGDVTSTAIPPPLILAIDYQSDEIYQLLMKHGANPNIKDPQGYSAVHVAAERGNIKALKDLIQTHKVKFNEVCDNKTPLHLAFMAQKWPTINYLKELAANAADIEREAQEMAAAQAAMAQTNPLDSHKVPTQQELIQADSLKNDGNVHYAQNNFQQAIIKYLEGLKIHPRHVSGRVKSTIVRIKIYYSQFIRFNPSKLLPNLYIPKLLPILQISKLLPNLQISKLLPILQISKLLPILQISKLLPNLSPKTLSYSNNNPSKTYSKLFFEIYRLAIWQQANMKLH